MLMSIISAFF